MAKGGESTEATRAAPTAEELLERFGFRPSRSVARTGTRSGELEGDDFDASTEGPSFFENVLTMGEPGPFDHLGFLLRDAQADAVTRESRSALSAGGDGIHGVNTPQSMAATWARQCRLIELPPQHEAAALATSVPELTDIDGCAMRTSATLSVLW